MGDYAEGSQEPHNEVNKREDDDLGTEHGKVNKERKIVGTESTSDTFTPKRRQNGTEEKMGGWGRRADQRWLHRKPDQVHPTRRIIPEGQKLPVGGRFDPDDTQPIWLKRQPGAGHENHLVLSAGP